MKKRTSVIIMSILTLVSMVFCLTGCISKCYHVWDKGETIKQPTCVTKEVKLFTCVICGETKTEEFLFGDHVLKSEGEVLLEPTCNEEGLGLYDCTLCDEKIERPIAKLPAVYTITMQGYGEYYVPASGEYSLKDAEKIGYDFVKWVGENGEDFSSKGRIDKDVTVTPIFSLLDTKTVEELEERAAGGADIIKIVNDIIIDRPIYVTGRTKIYSEKAVKLVRDENYFGDLFVVGMDKDGNSSILMCITPELTLGGEDYKGDEILLTIDGNRGKMSEGREVVGTALFLINSARVNMYNGVSVSNHEKLGNERLGTVKDFHFKTARTVGGGAVMISSGSSLYMYGGLMENNAVRTVAVTDETGEETYPSGYGGAIYNNGTFRMFGGVIRNCEANRGGAVYSNKIIEIEAGILEGNYASNKGGALCSSGSDSVDILIGETDAQADTVIFRGNRAGKQGGAILSYIDSPIILYGGILFDSNEALSSNGGAISTSGPITSYNNRFVGNKAKQSGGAIFHTYGSAKTSVRIVEIRNTSFEGNGANKGGAVMLTSSANGKEGAFAKIYDCKFIENSALSYFTEKIDGETGEVKKSITGGNGGAIYSSQKSSFYIENCEFEGNKSENLGGGAIGATVSSKITVNNSIFKNNSSVDVNGEEGGKSGVGGAIYAYNGSTLAVNDSVFDGNSAYKNGGAIYLSDNTTTLNNVEFMGNRASNGGAIYAYTDSVLDIDTIEFFGNLAKGTETSSDARGGAIYMIGATLDADKVEFNDNHADYYGGAIDAHTNSKATLNDVKFIENSSINNGGAVWSYTNTQIDITGIYASGNTSGSAGGFAYTRGVLNVYADDTFGSVFEGVSSGKDGVRNAKNGGAIYCGVSSEVGLEGVELNGLSATSGGAIYVVGNLNAKNCEFLSNTATSGGAVYIEKMATIDDCNFIGNSASYRGGAINVAYTEALKNEVKADIKNSQFLSNTATTGGENEARRGGAIYLAEYVAVSVSNSSFTENLATQYGGAIDLARGSSIDIIQSDFNKNSATNGGAIWTYLETALEISGGEFSDNTATTYGGAIYSYGEVVATEVNFLKNSANLGGAYYASNGGATVDSCFFSGNLANVNGGAIYLPSDTVGSISGTVFEENNANRGGAVYVSGGKLTVSGSEFNINTVTRPETGGETARGGAIFTQSGNVNVTDTKFNGNKAESNAGAIVANSQNTKYTLENVEFIGNTTTSGNGGAIWLYGGSTIDVKGIVAKGNKAEKGYGGVIYLTNGNLTVLSGEGVVNTFGGEQPDDGNVAETGGAIGGAGVVEINGASFIGNSASNGGAIFTSSTASTDDCTFTGNVAKYYGGAVCVKENASYFDNSSAFSENNSKNGGAIYLYMVEDAENNPDHVAAQATVVGSVFESNIATTAGGAINISTGAILSAEDASFKSNSALEGGAVSLLSSASKYIDNNSMFTLNVATAGEGGAINSKGILKFTGTKFVENKTESDGKRGGAVYLTAGYIEADGVTFDGNVSTSSGGALVITGAERARFNNGIFKNNTSGYRGGAIYVTNTVDVKTISCEFTSNVADSRGGAVYFTTSAEYVDGDGEIENSNSVFKNNNSVEGGALFADKKATLNGTVFENNTVVSTDETVFACGGAVASAYGTITVNKANFIGNTAEIGGAIYGEKKVTYNLSNVIFKENDATSGGAIYGAKVNADSCSFISNGATEKGGAVYVAENGNFNYTANEKLTFTDGVADATYAGPKFEGNLATNGAAIYIATAETEGAVAGTATITGATIINHSATANGGAIYANGALNTNNAVFYKNSTKSQGGAIYASKTYTDEGSLFIENTAEGQAGAVQAGDKITLNKTQFIRNESTANRAGALLVTGKLEAIEVLFEGNKASANGGAVVITGADASVFDGCTFKENVSENRAGAIYAHNSEVTTTLSCTFTGNTGVYGGAIYNTGTADYVDGSLEDINKGSVFTANDATNGGAIYSAGSVNVYGAEFNGNSATSGGAIYTSKLASLHGTVFNCNSATSGGAIYLSGKLETNTCTFAENEVTYRGGAVYIVAQDELTGEINANFNNSTFTSNKAVAGGSDNARRGGAIYVAEYLTVTVNGCEFTENAVTQYGGAIDVARGSVINVSDSDFDANTATNGGAIWAYSGSIIEISGGEFKNNVATGNGGAIYSYNTVIITSATFTANQSALGGAIYVANGSTTTKGCTFTNNVATTGGAIYVAKGTYTDGEAILDGEIVTGIENDSTFSGNVADNGGAIYVNGGNANAYGSTFNGNSVNASVEETTDTDVETSVKTYLGNGGAVYVASGAVYNDRNATYSGNIASLGGAIYTIGGRVNSTDSTFTENVAVTSETSVTNTENTETAVAYGKGGAVYVAENGNFNYIANEKLTFTDGVADEAYAGPKFEGNIAVNGAAIYIGETETEGAKPGNITVVGATFINHDTTGSGSAIYLSVNSINNVINDTVFYKNDSDVYGAAIYIATGVSVTSNGLIVVENSANRGGAVFMNGGNFTIIDSEFRKNVASVPEGKTTTARAGAIFAQAGTIDASGVKFIENFAESHGGAMVANSKNAKFYLENVEFIGNTSNANAGAIWLYSNAMVEITGIVAKGNKAENGYGGFAYLSSGTLSVLSYEGVINIFGGELEGEENIAKYGGAIGNAGTININDTSFIENSSSLTGGAIFTGGNANITNTTFKGNNAGTNGGAICVNGGETVTLGCIFENNSADNGGAVYVAKGTYTDGEAILDGETVTGVENGSTFSGNNTTGTDLGGGAIYTVTGAVLNGSTFNNNTSNASGGAVYSVGNLTVYYSNFTENESAGSGGAIYIIGDVKLLVVGGIMKDNKTAKSKNGGAICAYENEDKVGPTCTIKDTTFDGNFSYSGGAISLRNQGATKTEHILENITLINNKGGNGAIYIYNNTKVTVSGLVATNNVSSSKGSVFYVTSSKAPTLVIKDAQISGNSDASGEINFVYIANKTAVVDIYMDEISGDDFIEAGITDTTDITSAGWEKLIKNASSGTVNGYTNPDSDGIDDSPEQ